MNEPEFNRWIEVNLPWNRCADKGSRLTPPDLSLRAKKEFGRTPDELRDEISRKEWDRYHTLSEKIYRSHDLSGEDLFKKLVEDHPKTVAVTKVVAYWRLVDRVSAWYDSQPEWIEFKRKQDDWQESLRQRSFTGRMLNKPGTLIEVQNSNGVSVHLIGHINPSSGVCDDCTAFDGYDTIVLRYKIVWTPELSSVT